MGSTGCVIYNNDKVITKVRGELSFYTDGDFNMGGIEKLKDYCTKYDMQMVLNDPYHFSMEFNWDIKNEINGYYCEDLFYKLRDVFEHIGCEVRSHRLDVMRNVINMFDKFIHDGIFSRKQFFCSSLGGNYEDTEIWYEVLETADKVIPAPRVDKEEIHHIIYNLMLQTKGLGITTNDICYFTMGKNHYDEELVTEVVGKMVKHEEITTMFRDDGTLVYVWGRLR